MTETITSALSPEQWAQRTHQRHDENWQVVRGPDKWNPTRDWQLDLCRSGGPANVSPQGRQQLAALALFEQPYGFTPEDVAACREIGDCTFYNDAESLEVSRETAVRLRSLAARITALLPADTRGPDA